MKVSVITVSDRASAGVYDDRTGPEIERLLCALAPNIEIRRDLVPDDVDKIVKALERHLGSDFIFTAGGTGISPRDVTPEATEAFCDRPLPGISEILRRESYRETPNAMLSRGYAGVRNSTVVVNLPGSVKAAELHIRILAPILGHAKKMLAGESH